MKRVGLQVVVSQNCKGEMFTEHVNVLVLHKFGVMEIPLPIYIELENNPIELISIMEEVMQATIEIYELNKVCV